MSTTEKKINKLEQLMIELSKAQIETKKELYLLSKGMSEFKKEMSEFKEEMRLSRENSEKEMGEFKKEMNKKWGELANKMGTVVEDIVVPNIPYIAKKYFSCKEIDDIFIRRIKRNTKDRSKVKEFDVIAVFGDKLILNETKSNPRMEYVKDFIEFIKSGEIFDYFPEYKNKEIIPLFASLYVPDNIIKYFSNNNIYVMGMKEETMDLLNPELIWKIQIN